LHQTLGFRTLVFIVIASLFYALYRYRIKQIGVQHTIRKNIASDLHDDIGSTLNSIKNFTHLAKEASEANEYLRLIEESVKQTAMSLRDIIWVLDDTADTPHELIGRIKKFAFPICTAKNIGLCFEVEVPNKAAKLSKEEKRNLLLIAKEVINNAIKYADCSTIHIAFIFSNKIRKLAIIDNGKGFDLQTIVEGNGLGNIRYRAEQLSYSIAIQSSDKGTVVSLIKEI
jgi:signal transduction histidine kinase